MFSLCGACPGQDDVRESMMRQRIVTVIGATGLQGGGLVRAILEAPGEGFRVRAVTRTPDSPNARRLAALGVDVVRADLDDEASLDKAFAGAEGAFCVTNFWEHFSPEHELRQTAAMARAAGRARLCHVVWSTLEDTRRFVPVDDARIPTLMGRYKVPHFDAKGEANRLFLELGVPTTFLLTSFYWDNFISFGMEPRRAADGVLELALPLGDHALPGIAAGDIGRCAYALLREGERHVGETVGVAGEHLTGKAMAAALTDALGQLVRFCDVPLEAYRRSGIPGSQELANMFQFKREFSDAFRGVRDVEATRRLHPALQTFSSWLAANSGRIPLG